MELAVVGFRGRLTSSTQDPGNWRYVEKGSPGGLPKRHPEQVEGCRFRVLNPEPLSLGFTLAQPTYPMRKFEEGAPNTQLP